MPAPNFAEGPGVVVGFPAGAWGTNCYVLACGRGQECVVIDPGQDCGSELRAIIDEYHLRPVAVMLTHGHIDHVWSVAPVASGYGIPTYIHHADRYRLADPIGSSFAGAAEAFREMTRGTLELTEPEDVRELVDEAAIEIAGMTWEVFAAPGHTEGSLVYRNSTDYARGPVILSGDVLFAGSIGRTDLPGGDPIAMQRTLRDVVLTQPDAALVLPGHGPTTSIGTERQTNPYLVPLERGREAAADGPGGPTQAQQRGI